jgi:3-oxoadipate enol-lactonase
VTELRIETGSVSSKGEDIAYEVCGDGPAVIVLSHGLGGNHAVWFQQVPFLAETFRVVTWDQRGFGASTNRAGESGPAAAVTDLGNLLDHLGIERAHLVGQSMGGWAVLGYALARPERVRSLVICDSTAGIVTDAITQVLTTAKRRPMKEGIVGYHPALGGQLSSNDVVKAFLYQEIGGFRGEVDEADMIGKLFATSYPLDAVRALGIPALCIVGTEDDLIPVAAVKEVASVLGARLIEIADAGHSPYFEVPAVWNTAVLEFVTALE